MMVVQKNVLAKLQREAAHGLRPTVLWFAQQMELKLCANEHKSSWSRASYNYLLLRLSQEAAELNDQIYEKSLGYRSHERDAEMIIPEAADVANFAMMIADNCRVRETVKEDRR
jgi:predicted RecB family nuclease